MFCTSVNKDQILYPITANTVNLCCLPNSMLWFWPSFFVIPNKEAQTM